MKAILIYNPESEIERNTVQTLENKLAGYLVGKYDYRTVADIIPVRTTPAFILLRDDLQGTDLLDGDLELKIEGELAKIQEDEDLKLHQIETNRLDRVINTEKSKAQDDLLADMMGRGVI